MHKIRCKSVFFLVISGILKGAYLLVGCLGGKMNTNETIVQALAIAVNDKCKELGISLDTLADQINVAEGTLKNWCKFRTANPGIDTVIPAIKFLGLSVDEHLYPGTKSNKPTSEVSDNALKEIYEHQLTQMKESHEEHTKNIREHYERHISEIKTHYEARLTDKREHINTIMLDKKWFRLASVFSVAALLGVFFFIEFMTPGHGWFIFGK
jgi:transcriptional regulator with XRE-family HTH domain